MTDNTRNVTLYGNKKLQIKQFHLTSMVENPAIVMIAKRASGKSWVCRDILKNFKDIPVGIIIAPMKRWLILHFILHFFQIVIYIMNIKVKL